MIRNAAGRAILAVAISAGAAAVDPAATAGQVRSTIIGPGDRQVPIAVSALQSSRGAEKHGVEFAGMVVRNLKLSGMFRVIPKETYIEDPQSSGTRVETIVFESWSVLGALALVKGTLVERDGAVEVEARLFDVARRLRLGGRRFRGAVDDLPQMADRFADEVIEKVTGKRGPFDSKIAFLSTRGGRFKDVYVARANGTGVARLTETRTLNLAPRWGPSADRLSLTSYRDGDPELYSVSFPGAVWKKLTSTPGLNLGGGWSPDGDSIVTTIEFDGNSEIGLLDADGSVRHRLTEHSAIDVSPAWSPDGRSIAFCSGRAGTPQIYVMNARGGDVRRLTRHGSYNTSPAWSPDGEKIAYSSRIKGSFQIFTVNADGSGVHQVTTRGNNENPSWSPDGRYLVYSATERGRTHLFVSDHGGMHRAQLTDGRGDDTSPSWSGWLD